MAGCSRAVGTAARIASGGTGDRDSIGGDGRHRVRLGRHLCDSLPAIYEANRIVLEELGLPFDDARYRAAYVPDWRLMYQRLGVRMARSTKPARWLAQYAEAAEAGLPRVRISSSAWSVPDLLGLVTAGDRDVVMSSGSTSPT